MIHSQCTIQPLDFSHRAPPRGDNMNYILNVFNQLVEYNTKQ
jgi:hypothetical protein